MVHWICDSSPSFTLEKLSLSSCGPTVTLTLPEEEQEYLEPVRIKGKIYIGWCSSDIEKAVSVSDINGKPLGQFAVSKVQ